MLSSKMFSGTPRTKLIWTKLVPQSLMHSYLEDTGERANLNNYLPILSYLAPRVLL